MKLLKYIACAGLLALSACSSAPAASQTDSAAPAKENTATQEQPAKENATTHTPADNSADQSSNSNTTETPSTNNPVSSNTDVLTQGDKLRKGFADAGFSIVDFEQEGNEVSFDAYSQTSDMGADVEYQANASTKYSHLISDGDVASEAEYTSGTMTLSVLKNWEDGTYEIVAVDEANSLVYEIDDISANDLPAVKNIMSQLGFKTE